MSSSPRIPVGGKVSVIWVSVGVIAALAALVLAAMLFNQNDKTAAMILGGCGVLLLVIVVGWAVAVARTWREIEVLPGGFVVADARGESEFDDDDVVCVSLRFKRNFSNGEVKSVTRVFDLWLGEEDAPQAMTLKRLTNTIKVDQNDPLTDFINRIVNRLRERAKVKLAAGGAVEGEGWTLERSQLVVAGTPPRDVPLRDVESCAIVDEHVCLWVGDDETPSIRIPQIKANSHLLQILIDEELSQRPDEENADEPGLGRVIFERSSGKGVTVGFWVLMVLAAVALAGAIGVFAFGRQMDRSGGGALILVAVVLALIAIAVKVSAKSFRAHERGVSLIRGKKRQEMRYTNVNSFTWEATRMYVNGAYTGTTLRMKFLEDRGGPKPEMIDYSRNINVVDDELDNLRDHISGVIASKMYERFSRGEEVKWTPYMTFTSEGLQHCPSGFIKRKEAEVIPWGDIANFDLDQGIFRIWRPADKKSPVNEPASQDNFFPGFYMFLRVMGEKRPEMMGNP